MAVKSKKRKKSSKKNNSNKGLSIEIIFLIYITCIILFTISNVGLLGIFGKYLSGIFFTIFGISFYLITFTPIILIMYTFTKNINRGIFIKKICISLIGLFSIMCIIEILFNKNMMFFESIKNNFNHPHLGGGIISFFISKILVSVCSIYGAIIILCMSIAIVLLLVTDLKFFTNLFEIVRKKRENKPIIINKDNNVKEDKKIKFEENEKDESTIDIILEKFDKESAKTIDSRIIKDDIKVKNESDKTDNKVKENKVLIEPITSSKEIFNEYEFPNIELLQKSFQVKRDDTTALRDMAIKLKQTLDSFGVKAEISDISKGPSVTRFEIVPDIGVKVSKIVGLMDDIKLNLAAKDIRIEAPIPGKSAIGIEVPNSDTSVVRLRELIDSKEFKSAKSKLSFCVGLSIEGKPIIADIQKMPHVLIAGATGSGKSVCINTLIMSILYKARPDEVKLIMIDPKVVELSIYNGIPHLLIPVVTDPKRASGAISWAVHEMEKRYKMFAKLGVKDIFGYNEAIRNSEDESSKLPQIVIIVDELADLMMVASNEVESAICRLAQLARACGIHLVIATQRPSVNVITGLIKANIPSRIAFAVSSGVDSRTILDMNGAEKLLGRGDMLFQPAGLPKPIRVQGAFVDEKEVSSVVTSIAVDEVNDKYTNENKENIVSSTIDSINDKKDEYDEYFMEAAKIIVEKQRASIGLLQRILKIGFNRAARIMDQLFEAGVVGPDEGTKPRKILIEEDELDDLLEKIK